MDLIADVMAGLGWMGLVMIAGFIFVIAVMSIIGRGASTE